MPDDEAERHRKIKVMLGFDPDDPSISVQMVDTNPTVVTAAATEENDRAMDELIADVLRAAAEHKRPFQSAHEGAAYIQASFNRLWGLVASGAGYSSEARAEAIRVAADAVWYAMSLTGKED
jgi:hypothetical protein